MYLYQTWARQDLVNGALETTTDAVTGAVTRTGNTITTDFAGLESQTDEVVAAFLAAKAQAGADGTGGIAAIAPWARPS